MPKPYLRHLQNSSDLVTPYEQVRAGFVSLALEKNRRATPFVAQARALQAHAKRALSPLDLLKIDEIQSGLLKAAGISDKATNHLQESDKLEAIQGLIKNFLEPAGAEFVEELVFRFLLTCGDSLGGSMRNVGGFLAQKKLTRALLASLQLAGKPCYWLHGDTNTWVTLSNNNADVENSLRGISWVHNKKPRTLIYNLTVPIVKNNVDISLFQFPYTEYNRDNIISPVSYLALGELKGGIDPAGADEHWKTARSALIRIKTAFAKRKIIPHTFFIGAAIETKMAEEIWQMLKGGELSNAANLTNEDQIASIVNWIVLQ